MLEETLKAIEGPIASRKNQVRAQLPIGTGYQSSNVSGETEHRAATAVLQVDAFVCEDNIKHCKPLCRTPTDYKKFLNIIERASAETVEECVGMPTQARSTTAESSDNVKIYVETMWGDTPDIAPDRGYVQGSRGASELSKPVQSPLLNLRATSTVFFMMKFYFLIRKNFQTD